MDAGNIRVARGNYGMFHKTLTTGFRYIETQQNAVNSRGKKKKNVNKIGQRGVKEN
jgi:hypothetical protein